MYDTVCKYKGTNTARKKRSKNKFRFFLFLIALIFVAIVLYYCFVVSPIICSLSEEKIRSISTSVISQSVSSALDERGTTYDDLVHISYDKDNNISLIQNDSVEINKLVRRVTELVQIKMDTLGKEGIQIALGTFTGIPFLYGLGPMISLKLVPIGTVNTKFNSIFQSAGINQTRHVLNFEISTNIGMILPANTKNFVTSLDVAICESIIIGKIPDWYLTQSS